jgi:hypothetical protein
VLPVYKVKQREGTVERVEADGCTAVCRGMFQKETDLTLFAGPLFACCPQWRQRACDLEGHHLLPWKAHHPSAGRLLQACT